jgi:hypothetical protein
MMRLVCNEMKVSKTRTLSRCHLFLQRVLLTIGVLTGCALAQSPGEAPLISLSEPTFNQTYTSDMVAVTVHFRSDADPSTFRAQVNGDDVTSLFEQTSHCQSFDLCDVKAYLPSKYLLHGANAVSVEVNGPDDTVADNAVQFLYQAPAVQTEAVSKLIPSVAVWSVKLDPQGSENDYKSYEIVVGPGPNFPQVIYKASDLNCPTGINSVQVLVLQRKTLNPEIGNSRPCFGTARDLANFLKSVPKNDLVILNNFLGRMPNIDTAAIGGTNYANSQIDTSYYNAIGVAGAPAGTAYESYQPNASHTPRAGKEHLPPLVGSLMLDTARNYYFAPMDFPEIKIAAGTDGGCGSATYPGLQLPICVPENSLGAFEIVTIDRRLGIITDWYSLETNSNDARVRQQAISDLCYLLETYYKSNDLLAITTVGTPFRKSTEVPQRLFDVINRLGGNGYIMPRLTTSNSGYTLVTSPDPAYSAAGNARESTTARTGENAKLDIVLGRDRLNQFGLYQDYPGGVLTSFNGNDWPATIFERPVDWPAWTAGQEKAYLDLTSSNHYPTLLAALGCSTNCQPFREYYSGNMPTCTPPSFLAFPFQTLIYEPNPDYTQDDFTVVTRQLAKEAGYENNIYSLCGLVRQLTDSQKTNLLQQLKLVGDTINSSLAQKARDAQMEVDQLSKYGGIAAAGSSLPVIGAGFSALSTTLNSFAALVPSETGVPGGFTYTLAELNNKTSSVFGDQMTLLITNLFTAIANDWGKLSTIGGAYGSQKAPWYFCSNCDQAALPINALPLISLGAKRGYYKKLLPTAYSVDRFVEQTNPDPKKIVRTVISYGGSICYYPYGQAPVQAIWTYPNINKPSASDIFILTETSMASGPGFKELRFPNSDLLSDMLDAPVIKLQSLTLSGGAGLLYGDFLSRGNNLNMRAGYLPGSSGCRPPY